jgi:hypothetical protein
VKDLFESLPPADGWEFLLVEAAVCVIGLLFASMGS